MVATQLEERPLARLSKTGRAQELGSSRGPGGCREPGQEAAQGGQAGLRAER